MNHKVLFLFMIIAFVLPALSGCRPESRTPDLVTSAQGASQRGLAELTLERVLEHMLSAHHIPVPPGGEWQMEVNTRPDGEYRFRNDGMSMVIRLAVENEGNQHVVIIDAENAAFWCGSVEPDGDIIDTCLRR